MSPTLRFSVAVRVFPFALSFVLSNDSIKNSSHGISSSRIYLPFLSTEVKNVGIGRFPFFISSSVHKNTSTLLYVPSLFFSFNPGITVTILTVTLRSSLLPVVYENVKVSMLLLPEFFSIR